MLKQNNAQTIPIISKPISKSWSTNDGWPLILSYTSLPIANAPVMIGAITKLFGFNEKIVAKITVKTKHAAACNSLSVENTCENVIIFVFPYKYQIGSHKVSI